MSGSIDFHELEQFRENLLNMKEHAPEIMEELIVGEGIYAVKVARSFTQKEDVRDTGYYLRNWHTGNRKNPPTKKQTKLYDGSKPKKHGSNYVIDVYNNVDYAKHLEYGFRSHYVPPQYLSGYYLKRFPNGMYVGTPGKYVRGHFIMFKAIQKTADTQQDRLSRKWNKKVREYMERGLQL